MKGLQSRPIVHIGIHKTATSWFQRHFYPAVKNHRYVARTIVRKALLEGSCFAFDAAACRAELGLDESDLPSILCEEDLSGVLHDGGLANGYIAQGIAERIHRAAPDAQIVIFVRSQLTLAASCYQQYVRDGGTALPGRYFFPEEYRHLGHWRPFKVPRFSFTQFEHDRLIAAYDALFGQENVHVFAYEEFVRNRAAFLARFAERLGLAVDIDGLDFSRVNGGYRRALLPIARWMNHFTERSVVDKRTIVHIPYWYTVRKALLARLNRLPVFGEIPSPETLIGRETTRWIEQHFVESNRRLERRIGIDLSRFGHGAASGEAVVAKPVRSPLLKWVRN